MRWQRRHVVVEPGFIDFGVSPVSNDLLQPGVDFAQQFTVAFRHRNTEILTLKFGIRHQLELLLRVLFDVVLHHPDVANRGADAVLKQLLEHQRGIVEALDRGAVFTQHLRNHDIAGAGVHHPDLLVFQGRQRIHLRVLSDDDRLFGREVRRGEIDHLFAFIGDGDPGDDDVAVAGVQRGEDAFPWGIDQLNVKAFGFGDGFDDVDVETFQLFLAVFKFKRPVGAAGADGIGFRSRLSGSRQRGYHATRFEQILDHEISFLCIYFA